MALRPVARLGFSTNGKAALSDCGWNSLERFHANLEGYTVEQIASSCGPMMQNRSAAAVEPMFTNRAGRALLECTRNSQS